MTAKFPQEMPPDEQWDERIKYHAEMSTAKMFKTALATHARVESLRGRISELVEHRVHYDVLEDLEPDLRHWVHDAYKLLREIVGE